MDYENRTNTSIEPSVDEGAFWHTNLNLYYGYSIGDLVEVEHEPTKYWLAKILYSYKHLVLLQWIGDYGEEFWIDTSLASSAATGLNANTSCNALDDGDNNFPRNYPRRLFQLGHHLQSQVKSQFSLEKPTKFLSKPSLYNPLKDPYAGIKNIEDLLAHEISRPPDESNNGAGAGLESLVNNSTKINYDQYDKEELDAAIANLHDEIDKFHDDNHLDVDQSHPDISEEPKKLSVQATKSEQSVVLDSIDKEDKQREQDKCSLTSTVTSATTDNRPTEAVGDTWLTTDASNSNNGNSTGGNSLMADSTTDNIATKNGETEDINHDIYHKELCQRMQESAINSGRHRLMSKANQADDSNSVITDKQVLIKPKQFYDIGGANHERVFVPGTLLEVCHSMEDPNNMGQMNLYHWIAFVIKNVGGRLTLRWLLCDEPKFKQGRLELKSCKSKFICEEDQSAGNNNETPSSREVEDEAARKNQTPNNSVKRTTLDKSESRLPHKLITFSLHFCDPRIFSISYAERNSRNYRIPQILATHLSEVIKFESGCDSFDQAKYDAIETTQLEYVFDSRRKNLDKDRPLIDHILTTASQQWPKYLENFVVEPQQQQSNTSCDKLEKKSTRQEILISCPKLTKLVHGFIKRELEPNVFEIESDPLQDGEIIRFIYPYDSSYAILPLNWADGNRDCLSMNPSRTTSPLQQSTISNIERDKKPPEPSIESETTKSVQEVITSQQITSSQQQENSGNNSLEEEIKSEYPVGVVEPDSSVQTNQLDESKTKPEPDDVPKLAQICQKSSVVDESQTADLSSSSISLHRLHADDKDLVVNKFKVMDQLEVVHPSSDSTICLGRIRKVVFPLLWIQISVDSYTLLPFNSTDIYPTQWCETHQHKLVSFLPPRKRQSEKQVVVSANQYGQKIRKKLKSSDELKRTPDGRLDFDKIYVKESFDLGSLNERQASIDYMLNEKSTYIKIFFNHKCFTGPSLSKSKISTLPQYVGPGPMRLVMEEVVTKVISVAYVPPRILNDLSSKSFEDLLVDRNLKNTISLQFKAKYQKRVSREEVPICVNPDDVPLYCECLCEHLKCCYNLFGPNQYDGDDCPGHCRALTKSNKYMKRATYYRDKARAGEFAASGQNGAGTGTGTDSQGDKRPNGGGAVMSATTNNKNIATSRPRYAGRASSESVDSNVSRLEQVTSRASSSSSSSSSSDDGQTDQAKLKSEGLSAVLEEDEPPQDELVNTKRLKVTVDNTNDEMKDNTDRQDLDDETIHKTAICNPLFQCDMPNDEEMVLTNDEFEPIGNDENGESIANDPNDWTVDDVCKALEVLGLNVFVHKIRSECIDGSALLLLDETTILEHFQKRSQIDFASDELEKFCRFIEFAKVRLAVPS